MTRPKPEPVAPVLGPLVKLNDILKPGVTYTVQRYETSPFDPRNILKLEDEPEPIDYGPWPF